MQSDFAILEGNYLRDILDQPSALKQTLAALDLTNSLRQISTRLSKGRFKNVVLTGMGSSFHVLHSFQINLVRQGIVATMLEASELVHYQSRWLNPQTLIVAVSQSGESVEIVRLLEINMAMSEARSPIIGITNTAGSTLARLSDAVILTQAGEEFSVSCKTYLATLMALYWLQGALCGQDCNQTRADLEAALPAVQSYLANWREHVRQWADCLQGVRNLFLIGRGPSLSAVSTGALIIKESTHLHAEGMSSAAFRHGPLEMLREEIFILVFAGSDETSKLNKGLYNEIREKLARAELVGEDSTFPPATLMPHPPPIGPILEILPVQMMTLALGALTGREPGRFAFASKVTTRE